MSCYAIMVETRKEKVKDCPNKGELVEVCELAKQGKSLACVAAEF